MDISAAAMPPIQPNISASDREHPLFPLYQQRRNFCSNNLIQANAFDGWLYQYEQNLLNESASRHSDYPAFLEWMRANKGGGRQCPAGSFPHNFNYWREGGRW